ncbi:MAG TPA: hypothetical protein VNM14_05175 [Planctomycetota bacterium]|nr:hypothetical protein [Planctomycetota bacterium]
MSPVAALFVLALQVPESLQDSGERPNRASVEFSAVRQSWFAEFRGSARVDGGSIPGTQIRFLHDLHMPDDEIIPIYGGGDISITVKQTLSKKNRLLFSAEYWNHYFDGHATLSTPEVLGDVIFPAGSFVESHFHLTSLTLDAHLVHEEAPFRVGGTLPIQIISTRLRIDNPSLSSKETIRDVCGGFGVFADVRPIPYLFAGVSAKGFTGYAHIGRSGGGDFKGYGGVEWGPFRLEGGYRYLTYDESLQDQELTYVLDGAYVSFSLILRF